MIPGIPLLNIVLVAIHPTLSMFPAGFMECKVCPEERSYYRPSENCDGIGSHKFPDKSHGAVLQNSHNVLPHEIEVLLPHVSNLIFNFTSIVHNNECTFLFLRFLIEFVIFVHVIEFLEQCLIGCTRETANI